MFLLQGIYLQRVPGRFPQQCFLQRLMYSQGRCLRSKPFVSFKTAAQGGAKENSLAKDPRQAVPDLRGYRLPAAGRRYLADATKLVHRSQAVENGAAGSVRQD